MKILLYIICNKNLHNTYDFISDYQIDVVHHGLVSNGHDVDCIPDRTHMYKENINDNFKMIWGKGFTITGLLDKTKLKSISESYDVIIYGIHHTCGNNYNYWLSEINRVRSYIESDYSCILDGWDLPNIDNNVLDFCRYNNLLYFKRECQEVNDIIYPISFGIPEEKITNKVTKPKRVFAPLIPVNQNIDSSYMSTYIYDTEEDYYKMYQESMFGLTSKKGGWDTMRHYEIAANNCLPYFVDIEKCPPYTLFRWPKNLLSDIKKLADVNTKNREYDGHKILPHCGVIEKHNIGHLNHFFSHHKYDTYKKELKDHLYKNLTTKSIAKYLLETLCI